MSTSRFAYAINFAAFVTAIASEAAVWGVPKGIDGAVIFTLVPAFLIFINSLGVRVWLVILGNDLHDDLKLT